MPNTTISAVFPTDTPQNLGAVQLSGPQALLEVYSTERVTLALMVYGTGGRWFPVADPATGSPIQITLDGSNSDRIVAQLKGSARRLFAVDQTAWYLLWRTSAEGSATALLSDVGSGGGLQVQQIVGGNITLLAGQLTGFSLGGSMTNGATLPVSVDLGASDIKNSWSLLLTTAGITTDASGETLVSQAAALLGVASNGVGAASVTLAAAVGSGYTTFNGDDGKAIPSVSIVNGKVVLTLTLHSDSGVRAYRALGGNLDTIFEADAVGAGGNAITIATVADAGAQAGSVTVNGNALTIHYKDGVSTVADVEALFASPVAVTFGHVRIKTAGTGGNVLAAPGDTHSATALISGRDPKPTTLNVSGIVTSARG